MNGNGGSLIEGTAMSESIYCRFAKPVIDYLLSLVLFILTLIPMLILCVAVRMLIGAPGLVRVKCSGRNGRIFTRHDFRTATLSYGAEEQTGEKIGLLGGWLRRSGLYRLPNLLNCLKCEMFLTGPRPLDARFYYLYDSEEFERLAVRPGVFTPDYSDCSDWLGVFAIDSEYIYNCGLERDAGLFFGGLGRMLRGKCLRNAPGQNLDAFDGDGLPFINTVSRNTDNQFILMVTAEDIRTVKFYSPVCDLAREFVKNGHSVVIVSPTESRNKEKTFFIGDTYSNCRILKVRTSNFRSVGRPGRIIAGLTVNRQLKRAAARQFKENCFDTVINLAPPFFADGICEYIIKRDNARFIHFSYGDTVRSLADIDMIREDSLLYNILLGHEEKTYWLADRIMCGSERFREWLLDRNKWLDAGRAEICPLGIDINSARLRNEDKLKVREHFGLPKNKKIFIFTGSFDKKHDVKKIIDCIFTQNEQRSNYFVLAGNGEGYPEILEFLQKFGSSNVMLSNDLAPHDVKLLLGGSDAALVFGNYRQTVPTLPDELLYYMQAGLPVLAVTDENSAVKDIIEEGGFGRWINSGADGQFGAEIERMMSEPGELDGRNAYKMLKYRYSSADTYKKICSAGEFAAEQ